MPPTGAKPKAALFSASRARRSPGLHAEDDQPEGVYKALGGFTFLAADRAAHR